MLACNDLSRALRVGRLDAVTRDSAMLVITWLIELEWECIEICIARFVYLLFLHIMLRERYASISNGVSELYPKAIPVFCPIYLCLHNSLLSEVAIGLLLLITGPQITRAHGTKANRTATDPKKLSPP